MPEVLALRRQNQCVCANQLLPHSPFIQCTRENHSLLTLQCGRQLTTSHGITGVLLRPHHDQLARPRRAPQCLNRQMHILDRMNPSHQHQPQHSVVRRSFGYLRYRPLRNIRHQPDAGPRKLLLHFLHLIR